MVSRAMATEINEGRGCGAGKDYVLLDITHLDPATIMKRLPGIREIGHPVRRRRPDQGTDPRGADLPLPDGRHSRPLQRSGVPRRAATWPSPSRLLRGGECACASVHGANRLGTNSLLDLLVFGKSAGDSAVEDLKGGSAHRDLPADAAEKSLSRINALDNRKGGASNP